MRIKTILISIALTFTLTHCMTYDFSRKVVKQGNLLSHSTIEHLKIGMSKEDVAMLLGTSLLSPTFNNDRWDYAYTIHRGSAPLEIHHLSLYFAHQRLQRIEQQ